MNDVTAETHLEKHPPDELMISLAHSALNVNAASDYLQSCKHIFYFVEHLINVFCWQTVWWFLKIKDKDVNDQEPTVGSQEGWLTIGLCFWIHPWTEGNCLAAICGSSIVTGISFWAMHLCSGGNWEALQKGPDEGFHCLRPPWGAFSLCLPVFVTLIPTLALQNEARLPNS